MISFEVNNEGMSFPKLHTYFHSNRLYVIAEPDDAMTILEFMSNKGLGIVHLSARWIWEVDTNFTILEGYRNKFIISWPKVRLIG